MIQDSTCADQMLENVETDLMVAANFKCKCANQRICIRFSYHGNVIRIAFGNISFYYFLPVAGRKYKLSPELLIDC
jgi:hypothetical protein